MVLLKALSELRVTPTLHYDLTATNSSDHTVRRASVRLLSEKTPKEGGVPPTGCHTARENDLPISLSLSRRHVRRRVGAFKPCPSLHASGVHQLIMADCRSNQCSLFRGSRVVARYSTSVKVVVDLSPEKRDRFGVKPYCVL